MTKANIWPFVHLNNCIFIPNFSLLLFVCVSHKIDIFNIRKWRKMGKNLLVHWRIFGPLKWKILFFFHFPSVRLPQTSSIISPGRELCNGRIMHTFLIGTKMRFQKRRKLKLVCFLFVGQWHFSQNFNVWPKI